VNGRRSTRPAAVPVCTFRGQWRRRDDLPASPASPHAKMHGTLADVKIKLKDQSAHAMPMINNKSLIAEGLTSWGTQCEFMQI
jgi:hypothetical protein